MKKNKINSTVKNKRNFSALFSKKSNFLISDNDLVEAAKTDKECFLYLMHRYEKRIEHYTAKISDTSEKETEDLVQDIFLIAFINLPRLKNNKDFSNWLYQIAHKIATSYWLRKKRNQLRKIWDIYYEEELTDKFEEKEMIDNAKDKRITNFASIREKYNHIVKNNLQEVSIQ